MKTAHRQSSNSSVCFILLHTINRFYKPDDIRKGLFKVSIHCFRVSHCSSNKSARPFTWCCFLRNITIWHYHNHWFCFPLSNKIIQNLCGTTQFFPFILIASLRLFDAFEDVYVCEFQRAGRLDIGGQSWFWRSLTTAAAFSGMLIATGELLSSTVVTLAVSLVATVLLYVPRARGLFPQRPVWESRLIKELLIICLPLCLASFISMYLASAPRFSIKHYLDSTQQGYFTILFMPAMAINLLSIMVFRPLLTSMASLWVGADLPGFNRLIRRGLLVTVGAFVVVGTVTFLAGAPILGLVYGTDISMFRAELMVLVLGGAMNAASVVLYYALTTMRLQKLAFVGYALAAVAMTLMFVLLVPSQGLLGVSIAYTCGMGVLVLLFALFQHRAVATHSGEGHS